MSKKTLLAAFVASAMIFTSGCANKAQTGTFLGAGIGGMACNMLAKNGTNASRMLATAGCAAIGGYIGNKIGSMLDERDQLALTQQREMVLASSAPGAKYNWKSDHSGATATIETTREFKQTKPVQIKRVAAVQPAPANMKLLQAPYVTMKSANVRSAPTTQADKVGGMAPGTEFTAIGQTGDWILVGRKGVNVGYIHQGLVTAKNTMPAKKATAVAKTNLDNLDVSKPETKHFAVTNEELKAAVGTPETAAKAPETKETSIASVFDLGDMAKKKEPEVKVAAVSPSIVSDEVVTETTCKEVEVKVSTANGKTETSKDAFCKTGAGFENFAL